MYVFSRFNQSVCVLMRNLHVECCLSTDTCRQSRFHVHGYVKCRSFRRSSCPKAATYAKEFRVHQTHRPRRCTSIRVCSFCARAASWGSNQVLVADNGGLGFGEVRLVRMKGTQELFALKRLKKESLVCSSNSQNISVSASRYVSLQRVSLFSLSLSVHMRSLLIVAYLPHSPLELVYVSLSLCMCMCAWCLFALCAFPLGSSAAIHKRRE